MHMKICLIHLKIHNNKHNEVTSISQERYSKQIIVDQSGIPPVVHEKLAGIFILFPVWLSCCYI